MPPSPLVAQTIAVQPDAVSVSGFVVLTAVLLFLMWLLDQPVRPLATRLIMWGVLLTVASAGYAVLGVPAAQSLSRAGFVLIVGGVTWSVLAACCGPSISTAEARMSSTLMKWLIMGFGVLAYFVAFPEDAQAVTLPIATLLSISTALSPWFYLVGAVGLFSLAMFRTWGGRTEVGSDRLSP